MTIQNGITLPSKVRIVEVSPRDGLQNEMIQIPTAVKVDFINRLAKTGLKTIEVTSFVSPKWIPALADNKEVFSKIKKDPAIHYPVLVPNLKGLEDALAVNVKEIAVFTAVSETFSEKNTHCSIKESFARIREVVKLARENKLFVRGYLSCVWGCPYEGTIPLQKIIPLAESLFELCDEISLGDTIGVATPNRAREVVEDLASTLPIDKLAVHFHDTYGQALANIYASLQAGIAIIDSSIAGLGGCPYAKGASGNVATEDVIYMLDGLGIETGVDLKALLEVSRFVAEFTKRPPRSKVAMALQ